MDSVIECSTAQSHKSIFQLKEKSQTKNAIFLFRILLLYDILDNSVVRMGEH